MRSLWSVFLAQCYAGEQIKKNEMGRAIKLGGGGQIASSISPT